MQTQFGMSPSDLFGTGGSEGWVLTDVIFITMGPWLLGSEICSGFYDVEDVEDVT